jgi:hypothetical protein
MIASCKLGGENEYVISWKVPLQNEAKTNFACVVGSVAFEPVEPGFCTVGVDVESDADGRLHLRRSG